MSDSVDVLHFYTVKPNHAPRRERKKDTSLQGRRNAATLKSGRLSGRRAIIKNTEQSSDEDEDENEDEDEEEAEPEAFIRRSEMGRRNYGKGKSIQPARPDFTIPSPVNSFISTKKIINLSGGKKLPVHAHVVVAAPDDAQVRAPVPAPAPAAVSAPAPSAAPARAPGLDGVVATQTRLSLVDGLNGVLVIGGYPVEEIAGRLSIEEAALLLWTGNMPSSAAARNLRKELADCRSLRPETLEIIRTARNSPPIDALRMACATLSLGIPNPNDITPANDLALAKRLLGCFPTVIAAHARLRKGLEPIAPHPSLGLAANFLYMTFGVEPDPIAVKALETYWVTVCEHGMNASTFAARVIASTRSDMISAVTGAVGAMKGPLHGGAPGPVLDMLVEMKTADAAEGWLRKEMGEGRRIMGFGHRIYKVRDPRAEVLAKMAEEMAGAGVRNSELYTMARSVEKTALRVLDELKPGRNLKTNVEFYTALVLQSIGLEPDQFVSLFACGRVVGWCAHVIEQHQQDHLLRPQSQYIGPRLSLSRQEGEEEE